jgi:hypothetical protein
LCCSVPARRHCGQGSSRTLAEAQRQAGKVTDTDPRSLATRGRTVEGSRRGQCVRGLGAAAVAVDRSAPVSLRGRLPACVRLVASRAASQAERAA